MKLATVLLSMTLCYPFPPVLAERINQEGRILGPPPVVTSAVLFKTADAAGLAMFPALVRYDECER